MNIDDFLKQKQFQILDEYLTSEMNRTAGEDLVSQIIDFFETPEKARDWYFSSNRALGGERPYDICKRGDGNVVLDELGRIDHGIYS